MADRDFKNLTRGTASDKILHDEAFNGSLAQSEALWSSHVSHVR